MLTKNNNLISCSINGRNLTNFLNLCIGQGVNLIDIKKETDKVFFSIVDQDFKKLKKLNIAQYNFKIEKIGGIKKLYNLIIKRIGIIIGCVLGIVFLFVLNNRLLQFRIYGLINTPRQAVIEELKDIGIEKFSIMNFDKQKVENYLSSKFKFSLVSIISKGNTLIISIKEELPDISDSFVPITADYNMVIKSMVVYSGTAIKKVGDVVYKGDILVEPYIKDSKGDIVYLSPTATIEAEVYYVATEHFKEKEKVLLKTGKKQVYSTSIFMGKNKIISNKQRVKFENFDTITTIQSISKYFLPIKFEKVTAYELKEKTITRNFEKEKNKIIKNLKLKLYNEIDIKNKDIKEDIVITKTTDGYIINFYLTDNKVFKYRANIN